MVTVDEANLNFYFRDGDYEHSFENGQREHPVWRGRSEVDVLCERVAKGFKPVATIVIQPAWSKARCAQVIAKVEAHDLAFSVQRNEWGVSELYMAAAPEKTLAELLVERGDDGVGLVLGTSTGRRSVTCAVSAKRFTMLSTPSSMHFWRSSSPRQMRRGGSWSSCLFLDLTC